MKHLNEKGNTLIIVLITFTVFTILFLSIMGMSLSNAKQINKTEENTRAVSIAEMGVIYYKTAVLNKSEEIRAEIETTVSEQIQTYANQISNGKITDENKNTIKVSLEQKVGDILSTIDTNEMNGLKEIENDLTELPIIDTTYNAQFTVSPKQVSIVIKDELFQLFLPFSSTGYYALPNKINGEGTVEQFTINSDFYIPIDVKVDFTLANNDGTGDNGNGGSDGDSNNGSTITGLTGNDIKDPGILSACGDTFNNFSGSCQFNQSKSINNFNNVQNATIKTIGDFTLSGNANNLKNTTLYTTGALIINPSLNQVPNLKIHSDGNIAFKGNVEFQNSQIETSGDGTFQNFKAENSTLYIGKKGTFSTINGLKNSKMEIKSEFSSGNWNNVTDSIISINGGIEKTIIGQINSSFNNSVLFIKGDTEIQSLNSPDQDSKFIILGNATINKVDLKKAFLYVEKDAYFSNFDMNNNDTKICVKGTLDINGNFNKNGNGKVYAKKLSDRTKNIQDIYKKVDTNPDNFDTNCQIDIEEGDSGENNNPITYTPVIVSEIKPEESQFDAEYDY